MLSVCGFVEMYRRLAGAATFASWIVGKVRPRGDWDFKQSWGLQKDEKAFRFGRYGRMSIDDFGNLHFGFVFASVAFPREMAIAGATAEGLPKAGLRRLRSQLQVERRNNVWINRGYTLYFLYGPKTDKQRNQYYRGSGGRGWA